MKIIGAVIASVSIIIVALILLNAKADSLYKQDCESVGGFYWAGGDAPQCLFPPKGEK